MYQITRQECEMYNNVYLGFITTAGHCWCLPILMVGVAICPLCGVIHYCTGSNRTKVLCPLHGRGLNVHVLDVYRDMIWTFRIVCLEEGGPLYADTCNPCIN